MTKTDRIMIPLASIAFTLVAFVVVGGGANLIQDAYIYQTMGGTRPAHIYR